jgi:hypothetical protein
VVPRHGATPRSASSRFCSRASAERSVSPAPTFELDLCASEHTRRLRAGPCDQAHGFPGVTPPRVAAGGQRRGEEEWLLT